MSYSRGKQYFYEEDGKQNCLVFLPKRRYFKINLVVNVIDHVLSWQSKGISNESIKPPATSNNSLNPRLILLWYQNKGTIYRKLFKTTKFYVYS